MHTQKAILLVDDEDNIRIAIKRELHDWAREKHLEVLTSASAKSALETIDSSLFRITVVVSDLKMPEMSGSDLLIEIKKKHPEIITMLLTGYLEASELMKAVSAGIYSFMLKPWDHDYLISELEKAFQQYMLKEENEALQARLLDELRMAGELQKGFLRPSIAASPKIEFRMSFKPVEGIYCSKNYYDVISITLSKHIIIMGDVDSFGVRAAMITAMLKAVIYPEYISGHGNKFSPTDFLDWLNHRIYKDIKGIGAITVSLFVGVLDLSDMSLIYANAGHTHPFLYRMDAISEIPVSSQPLGNSTKTLYAMNNVQLRSNDTILFYSFGLSNQNTDKHLIDILRDIPTGNNFQQRIIDKVLETSSGNKYKEDVTMLTVQLK
jgi:Response regulator containing CheY-like receiver, AAA-type ATPase, and DNA-binding domains